MKSMKTTVQNLTFTVQVFKEGKNFVSYNPNDIAKFSHMPQATKDYYKEIINKSERPLLYHRIPHILYKGSLDTVDMPIISV